ncbi:helix-turn-helix domain-containing protein [Marinobacter shengliensis]|uniref:XRE family transcriptional regulator n=1 Tax=Marinobacter shengliensis TaxID=1389223 RepID=UPI002572DC66|nr:XRE family transcriptional regulator [Marinobacter shengliensis]BEH15185.1 transcriptional regulator [Marinobacter shengliensis]
MNLISGRDVQVAFAAYVQERRKALKWSRAVLAARSTVPAPTIKKFETTGQISLRQFILLWQCVDDLHRLQDLTSAEQEPMPRSLDEVLAR